MLRASHCVLALALLMRTRCSFDRQDEGPCTYEDTSLLGSELTPWGTVLEEDLAQLTGPYEGTWIWQESHEYVEIVESGQSVPARATLEIDSASYRLHERTSGSSCPSTSLRADGEISFRDLNDEMLLRVPITLERWEGSQQYYGLAVLSPVEDYTGLIVPNPEIEAQLDVSGLSVDVTWGPAGESLYAYVNYGGQQMLTNESGWGPNVFVAEFVQ